MRDCLCLYIRAHIKMLMSSLMFNVSVVFVRCRWTPTCTVFELGIPNGHQNPKTAGLRLCVHPHQNPKTAGLRLCVHGVPVRIAELENCARRAPAATDKSNGYIEYGALHQHLDMCSYVETQAITHIAFSLPCRLC